MKPSALVSLFIVSMVMFGCVQPLAPPLRLASTTPACDGLPKSGVSFSGNDFVSDKVAFLSASYQPQSGAGPVPGNFMGPVDPKSQYGQDLAGAFNMAPDFFKNTLCGLTNVFIAQCADATHCTPDDAASNSWGLREYMGAGTGEYIATSAALWGDPSNPSPAPFFNDYKTKRLLLLLTDISGSDLSNWPSSRRPTYSGASTNTSAMSVLAALAHEMGHVLWYDKFVPNRGQSININNFCGGFYTTGSWTGVDIPPNRWISFGMRNDNIKLNSQDYYSLLQQDLQAYNFGQAGEDLHKLFMDSRFTGTLAIASPDEDFVETYMLYVLLESNLNGIPQLTDLTLTIHGNGKNSYKHNIVKEAKSKYELLAKMSCFGPLPQILDGLQSSPRGRRGR
jgi:hypothetical protein